MKFACVPAIAGMCTIRTVKRRQNIGQTKEYSLVKHSHYNYLCAHYFLLALMKRTTDTYPKEFLHTTLRWLFYDIWYYLGDYLMESRQLLQHLCTNISFVTRRAILLNQTWNWIIKTVMYLTGTGLFQNWVSTAQLAMINIILKLRLHTRSHKGACHEN